MNRRQSFKFLLFLSLVFYSSGCRDDGPILREEYEIINHEAMHPYLYDYSTVDTIAFHRVTASIDDTLIFIKESYLFDTIIVEPGIKDGAYEHARIYRERERYTYKEHTHSYTHYVEVLPQSGLADGMIIFFFYLGKPQTIFGDYVGQWRIGDRSADRYSRSMVVGGKSYKDIWELPAFIGHNIFDYSIKFETPDTLATGFYCPKGGGLKFEFRDSQVFERI